MTPEDILALIEAAIEEQTKTQTIIENSKI